MQSPTVTEQMKSLAALAVLDNTVITKNKHPERDAAEKTALEECMCSDASGIVQEYTHEYTILCVKIDSKFRARVSLGHDNDIPIKDLLQLQLMLTSHTFWVRLCALTGEIEVRNTITGEPTTCVSLEQVRDLIETVISKLVEMQYSANSCVG